MTDFLFPMPSYLSGAARTLDLFGVFDEYNQSATPTEADFRAIYNDWAMTGNDLQVAIDKFSETLSSQQSQPENK